MFARVQELLQAMAEHDGSSLFQMLLPEAVIMASMPDGTVRKLNADEFVRRSVTGQEKIRERIWDPQVSVQGDVATLIRGAGGWRVATFFFTIRTEGCPLSPLDAPPSGAKPRRR